MSGGGQAMSDPQYELPQALITEDRLWSGLISSINQPLFNHVRSFRVAKTRMDEKWHWLFLLTCKHSSADLTQIIFQAMGLL